MSSIRPLGWHHPAVNLRLGGTVALVNGIPADVAAVRAVVSRIDVGVLRRLVVIGHPRISHVVLEHSAAGVRVGGDGRAGPLAWLAGGVGGIVEAAVVAVKAPARLIDDLVVPLEPVSRLGGTERFAFQHERAGNDNRSGSRIDLISDRAAGDHAVFVGLECHCNRRKPAVAIGFGKFGSGVGEVREGNLGIRTQGELVAGLITHLDISSRGFVRHVPQLDISGC
jgi:hypothetical protein